MCVPSPVAGKGLAPWSAAMRMPSPLSKWVSRRDQFYGLGTGAEMRAHHRGAPLEAAGGEDDGIGIERGRDAVAALNGHAADATALRGHDQPTDLGFVKNFDACSLRGVEQLVNNGAAAADRLDPCRTGAEIIGRRDEFDAVALQPSDCRGRILRQRPK